MFKIVYIIIIFFVCFKINSCAEIDRSLNSANYVFEEQEWFSAYDFMIGSLRMSSVSLFKPEQNLAEKDQYYNPKSNNIFLVKQNSSGSREWIIDLGLSDGVSGISMTFDSSNNVYITGYKRNSLQGKKDSEYFTVFLVKYNSFGIREWIKKLGESKYEGEARLIVDSSDNIYITGFSSVIESENEFGYRDTLLVKYNTSGNREWSKKLGSTLYSFEWDLTVDSMDNIYVTGFSEKSFVQINSWQDDIIMKKFNTKGSQL